MVAKNIFDGIFASFIWKAGNVEIVGVAFII